MHYGRYVRGQPGEGGEKYNIRGGAGGEEESRGEEKSRGKEEGTRMLGGSRGEEKEKSRGKREYVKTKERNREC